MVVLVLVILLVAGGVTGYAYQKKILCFEKKMDEETAGKSPLLKEAASASQVSPSRTTSASATTLHKSRPSGTTITGDYWSIHWRQPSRGCRGHIRAPPIFWLGDVNWNIFSNIITYFKFSTSEFTKICHFKITKKFLGGSTPSAHSTLFGTSSPNLELALTRLETLIILLTKTIAVWCSV